MCIGNVSTDCPMNAFDKNLEEIARSIVSSFNDKSENICIFIAAFETLVDILGVNHSEKNYNDFTRAMNEIAQVQELCKEDKTAEDIQKIADEIVSAFSVNSKNEDISTIRELLGKLLCNAEKTRSKRQSDKVENCECPLGGIQNISSYCEFYKCLNSNNLKSIFGFDQGVEDIIAPCLAFVVDTTGSMSEEIDAVKRIILEFVHAEKEFATSEGCYMLVPFNDVGPDKANVPDESECSCFVRLCIVETGYYLAYALMRSMAHVLIFEDALMQSYSSPMLPVTGCPCDECMISS